MNASHHQEDARLQNFDEDVAENSENMKFASRTEKEDRLENDEDINQFFFEDDATEQQEIEPNPLQVKSKQNLVTNLPKLGRDKLT